jgi:hypothetical protein
MLETVGEREGIEEVYWDTGHNLVASLYTSKNGCGSSGDLVSDLSWKAKKKRGR